MVKNTTTRLRLYPAPATHTLNVEGQIDTPFEIMNAIGQTVIKGHLTSSVDISTLPNGHYWLKTMHTVTPFIKQ